MPARDTEKAAKEYLKKQAEIIRQYGEAPKLSGDEYLAAVKDTAHVFRSLAAASKTGS